MKRHLGRFAYGITALILTLGLSALGPAVGGGSCGPFADVSGAYCPFVLTLYYNGITSGTSPTTFSPDESITRGQAAVFTGKAFELGARRAADETSELGRF